MKNKLIAMMMLSLAFIFSSCSTVGVDDYLDKITDPSDEEGFYVIFAALHSGSTSTVKVGDKSYHVIIDVDMLEASLSSAIGDPVIKDHSSNSVDSCIGRIVDAHIGTDKQTGADAIFVVAKITDKEAEEKFDNNLYYKVSMSFHVVFSFSESIDDNNTVVVPVIVEFHEISVVNVPSDRDARAVMLFWGKQSKAIEFSRWFYEKEEAEEYTSPLEETELVEEEIYETCDEHPEEITGDSEHAVAE